MQTKKSLYEISVFALFFIVAAAQIFFMFYLPPHLDELYYIDWTNHLNLGYIEHPPLLSYCIFFLKGLFGKSIFALRFISFFSFLSVLLVFYLLFKDVFYVLSQVTAFLLFYSTTLVTENLFYALSLWGLYFYQKAYIKNQLRDFFLGAIFIALAILTNLMGLLFLGGLCFVWIFYRKNIRFHYLMLSFILIVFILSPYLYWVFNHFSFLVNHLKWLTGGLNTLTHFLNFVVVELLFSPLTVTIGFYVFLSQLNFFLKRKGHFLKEQLLEAKTFFFLLTIPIFFYYLYKMINSKIEFYWIAPLLLLLNLLLAFSLKEGKMHKTIFSVAFFYAGIVFIGFYALVATAGLGVINPRFAWNYYGMGQFSDPDFKHFYEEKLDKNLPFVSRRYQVPAIINYYLEPKMPSRVLATKIYHQTVYNFNYKDSETIRHGMYYIDWTYSDDLEKISSFYAHVEEIAYPESLRHKKNSHLWSFPKIFKMTGFLPKKEEEMLELVHNNGGL